MQPPGYFESIRARATDRWEQLEADPELAGPWHQLFKQVQSPRHVLSELLQNADDAKAKRAYAAIQGDDFVFEHDGVDFAEEHFASLCKFGYSNKRNLHTIGFRGVGFKSTFSLGDEVRLLTPTLSVAFHRDRFTQPVWVDQNGRIQITRIRVPIKDEHRRKELEKNLREWAASSFSLLFFRSIKAIKIQDTTISRRSRGPGPVRGSQWVTLSEEQEEPFLLIRSKQEAFPEEAIEEIRQERMGADDLEMPPCEVELVLGTDDSHRLYVVLPTGVETGLPFACNAPFVQDPARVKIKDPETSPTNRWLLMRAGRLAAETMISWVARTDLPLQDRCAAYRLFPDVDREDESIEGVCATICEEAFEERIEGASFLITDQGDLAERGNCITLPKPLYDVWEPNQLSRFFDAKARPVLSRHVAEAHQRVLENWHAIETLDESAVLDVLESKHLPKPPSWRQLMTLWSFVADDVGGWRGRTGLRIVPVHSRKTLHATDEVVRLGEKKILSSDDDWDFLSKYLLVLNANWPRFITKSRREAEESDDEDLLEETEHAYNVLSALDLGEASDVDEVIQTVAARFLAGEDREVENCVRLTHIAAALGANVPEDFSYVTLDGALTPVAQGIVVDLHGDFDDFVNPEWYQEHVLAQAYTAAFTSCTQAQWRQWAASERSRLLMFVPVERQERRIWAKSEVLRLLEQRGVTGEPNFPYRYNRFFLEDWDFDERHWELWTAHAKGDTEVWGRLFLRILELPLRHLFKEKPVQITQEATTGRRRTITYEEPLPGWIIRFRSLPCLPDTHGQFREPAELLRRTPETEALLDIEPFVRAELDTEQNRRLLIKLGVRDTPTGPGRLLERVRALARAENPPIHELDKWYGRLDDIASRCSTDELSEIRQAFFDEALIYTHEGEWTTSNEVFLNANEDDVPGAAVIHRGVSHLSLWHKLGVADHPTAELALDWLGGLESGGKLAPDELRRVRSLLPRYASQIWNECGHWLNLENEWAPIEGFQYRLTMQSLVPWSNLFTDIKRKTADFQRLSNDLCSQEPFCSLPSLSACIEDRIEEGLCELPEPVSKPWLQELGKGLVRARLENEEVTQKIREIAKRMGRTVWQPATGLESTPYIDGVPVGSPRRIDVLWEDTRLYVEDRKVARIFKAVAQELSRPFERQDFTDAVKACVERSAEFVNDYLEENFNLEAEEAIALTESDDTASPSGGEVAEPASTTPGEDKRPEIAVRTGPEEEQGPQEQAVEDEIQKGPENESVSEQIPTAGGPDGTVQPLPKHPPKPQLVDLFAQMLGYTKDGPGNRYYHPDGSWLQRSDGDTFPWARYSSDGEIQTSYWIKDHCLEREPLEIKAEVFDLCKNAPATHALVLADAGEHPVEISGERLVEMIERGEAKLFPARYRLKLEATYQT